MFDSRAADLHGALHRAPHCFPTQEDRRPSLRPFGHRSLPKEADDDEEEENKIVLPEAGFLF